MSTAVPQIVVVSGLPVAGKSTTAHELACRFERAAHVEPDRLQELIVAGAALPGVDGIDPEARRQLDLRLRNACLLTRSFARDTRGHNRRRTPHRRARAGPGRPRPIAERSRS